MVEPGRQPGFVQEVADVGRVLGGEFGIGTFIAVFCGGPCLQKISKLMGYDVKKTRNESFGETYAFLKDWFKEKKGQRA